MSAEQKALLREKKQPASANGILQRSAINKSLVEVPPIVYDVLRSPSQPLDSKTQKFFEQFFKHDFSQVRLHDDAEARSSASKMNALGYTSGQNIVVRDNFSVKNSKHIYLLAHELVHVIQQAPYLSDPCTKLFVGDSENESEVEAKDIATNIMQLHEPHAPQRIRHHAKWVSRQLESQQQTIEPNKKPDILKFRNFAERLLAEAKVEIKPGYYCSPISIKRYVRAYLDYHYLEGLLYVFENLQNLSSEDIKCIVEYVDSEEKEQKAEISSVVSAQNLNQDRTLQEQRIKKIVLEKLKSTLHDEKLAKSVLAGGPDLPKQISEGNLDEKSSLIFSGEIRDILKIIGIKDDLNFYTTWQGYGEGSDVKRGATKDIAKEHLGNAIVLPGNELETNFVKKYNIYSALWKKLLKPGWVIQTWISSSGENLSGLGHSFYFVEYVYSPEEHAPGKNLKNWELYSSDGKPVDQTGKEYPEGFYIVKPGETLTAISEKFNIGLEELKSLNPDYRAGKNKEGQIVEYFNAGALIDVKNTTASKVDIKGLYLVGIHSRDQNGDKIYFRDESYPMPWPKVWFAAQSYFE